MTKNTKSGVESIKEMEEETKAKDFDEYRNPPERVITLIKEKDGNWRGYMKKGGRVIEERQFAPEIVLQALLVHE